MLASQTVSHAIQSAHLAPHKPAVVISVDLRRIFRNFGLDGMDAALPPLARTGLAVVLAIAFAGVQAGLPPLPLLGAAPVPLVSALVIAWTVTRGVGAGALLSVPTGFLLASMSFAPLWLPPLALLGACLTAGAIRQCTQDDLLLPLVMESALAALVYEGILYGILRFSGAISTGLFEAVPRVLLSALLTGALLVPVLVLLLRALPGFTAPTDDFRGGDKDERA